jgi:hypothetical protein
VGVRFSLPSIYGRFHLLRVRKLHFQCSNIGSSPIGSSGLGCCSSMVEQSTVNREVVGSSPTCSKMVSNGKFGS